MVGASVLAVSSRAANRNIEINARRLQRVATLGLTKEELFYGTPKEVPTLALIGSDLKRAG